MNAFSFPKGSEEYDDEMLWNQHELAKNVKRAMIDEWHETRKIHGIDIRLNASKSVKTLSIRSLTICSATCGLDT